MSTKKRWTVREEEVLEKCLKKCKTKKAAFLIASEKTGRSLMAVAQHYYLYASEFTTEPALDSTKESKHELLLCTNKQKSSFLLAIKAFVKNLFD